VAGPKEEVLQFWAARQAPQQHVHIKVRGLETTHLWTGLPFPCISLDRNIFSSFFSEREIDEESNISGFTFFEALLN